MSEITIPNIIDWCDKKTQEGCVLNIEWDGGCDEGWIKLKVDGANCYEPEAEKLADMMFDQIDYGGWSGNCGSNGAAAYDPETKVFIGVDEFWDHDDCTVESRECDVELRVPNSYEFDSIIISANGAPVDFEITLVDEADGTSPEYKEYEEIIQKTILMQFKGVYKKLWDEVGSFNGITNEYDISRTEFKEDGQDLVFHLKTIYIRIYSTTVSNVKLDLLKLLHD